MQESKKRFIEKMDTASYRREFTSRIKGIVDTDKLLRKTVTIVGLGSVGSVLGMYLAQSAVGNFILIEPNKLSAANTCRHAADIHFLEMHKTKAVADLILARNPEARVRTFEEDFLALTFEEQIKRLENSDLVIAATDMAACQFAINEASLKAGVPALYVGCYERARAGEIVFVIPGVTPCLNCLLEFRTKKMKKVRLKERPIPYTDEDEEGLKAEPGLAIDIGFVTVVAAGFALALLDADSKRQVLLDPEKNLILLHAGSEPEETYRGLFKIPFDYVRARLKRTEPCEICQDAYRKEAGNAKKRAQSG
jgi:molybdopterin/thiamine biosynthesis adenylyltransferase